MSTSSTATEYEVMFDVHETPACPDSGIPAGSAAFTESRAAYALTGLTVVLPCFNEADNVADAVRAATRAARRCASSYEVIVIDDGSSDDTARITGELAVHDPNVRLVVHPENLGYGAALRSGIEAARMPWVLLTDADLQFDLGELENFLPAARNADLVAGWRILRQDPAHRRANAAAWNWLVRRVVGVPVRDVDCAFKLIRSEVIAKLPLQTDDFFIDTEIVASARKWNFRIGEKGVRHYPRVAGETTVNASDVTRTLATIARMWRRIYVPSAQQRAEADAASRRIVAAEYEPEPVGASEPVAEP